MRLSRRFASIAAAFALATVSLGLAPSAEAHPRWHKPKDVQLQVLSFNDFHGHLQPPGGRDETLGATLDPSNTKVGGAEYLASTLATLRAKARNSHTVAAGDLIGGSPFLSGLFHDEPAVESLNAMGLDVSSVGNHEFDEGVRTAADAVRRLPSRGRLLRAVGRGRLSRARTSRGWPPMWSMRRPARPCCPAAPSVGSRHQGGLHRDDPGGHARAWSLRPASRASSSATRWRPPTRRPSG